jgi:hypothetical protein
MTDRASVEGLAKRRMIDAHETSNLTSTPAAWQAWQQAAVDWLVLHPEMARLRRGDPATTPTAGEMNERAERIREAMSGIPADWRLAPATDAKARHMAQVGWTHELLAGMYEAISLAVSRLRRGDEGGLETAVQFLESDADCFRSGYVKEEVIRFLTRLPLDPGTTGRLEEVVLMIVDGYDRREFRSYIRLARRLDSPSLRRELQARASSADSRTRRHAKWMLSGLERTTLRT